MSSSTIKVLGIDLGKSKFHLIGLNAQGQPILKKQFPLKGNKTDFNDALAIAEASQSATMRFAQIKSEQAQCLAAIHRIREGFVTERTAVMSRIGALLLEFGLSFPRGHAVMKRLTPQEVSLSY